jgi:hypothetical protein
MSHRRSRFVLLCQQALACAVVVAVAAPAAGIIDLEIVAPPSQDPARAASEATGPDRSEGSLVAAEPVVPTVTEVPITDDQGVPLQRATRASSAQRVGRTADAVRTAPHPVHGYATVGVTWDHADQVPEGDIAISVRSLQDGSWSPWQELPYDADHGPDPGSAEARHARNGTEPVVVGDVDDVQVKAVTAGGEPLPDGMSLAVVDPGATAQVRREEPAIDTAQLASAETATRAGSPADVTPRPQIYSRAQWGADEQLRDRRALRYSEVHAGFVHHTVNANGYTEAQVPSIIRGIYAYHTKSRGWSDIGYNFLVDRFGRIWEGRYGGVDRPVVGAHTLHYNDDAFAMSSIGNYETARPSQALLEAYGQLFAWKLGLHGVDAGSTRQWVHDRWLPAINGHRDVGKTACPGRYLYAQIPEIRRLAAADQRPFTSRAKSTDVSGTPWPDLVVRDSATGNAVVVRTGGQVGFAAPTVAATGRRGDDLIVATPDVTGDGVPDLLGRSSTTGRTSVYPGDGAGHYGAAVRSHATFAPLDQLAAPGDLTGDGLNDVVGRRAGTTVLKVYPGTGTGGFGRARVLASGWTYTGTTGAGDFDGDGTADLLARDGGRLLLVPGTGRAGVGAPVMLPRSWAGYDLVSAAGDVTTDGVADLVTRVRSDGRVYVYPGDGHGGLGQRVGPFTGLGKMNFLAVAGPVTGSGPDDLVARRPDGRVVVLANRGGTPIEGIVPTMTSLADTDLVLNVGDWNGDGWADLMTRQASTGSMLLRTGDGNDGFAAPVVAATGWGPVRLVAAVGDLTGDGYPDLVGQPAGEAMRIYPGDGVAGFAPSYVAHRAIDATAQAGLGTADQDGSPDSLLQTAGGDLLLYPGNGPGGLTNPKKVASGAKKYDWVLGAGDLDGDGRPDVLVRTRADGRLWMLPGTSTGFGPRRFVADGFSGYDLAG